MPKASETSSKKNLLKKLAALPDNTSKDSSIKSSIKKEATKKSKSDSQLIPDTSIEDNDQSLQKSDVRQQNQLLEYQLRQFEERASVDRTKINNKIKKKQKKEKKENLMEVVKQDREKRLAVYKENVTILKRKRHGALVSKQKELIKLLTNK
ncbi:glycylpeptide N-tetradecanoyltransferase [Acrasis kona]|uniref:Glycylpeptide N-tetradecanoyltransferase n=1 Tax=Acrasis kona TaxID=1008807 RepID=A0AAW2ZJY3_9EUKA